MSKKWKLRLLGNTISIIGIFGLYQFVAYSYVVITEKNAHNYHALCFIAACIAIFFLGSIQDKFKCQARACAFHNNGYCVHNNTSGTKTNHQDCEFFVDTYN